MPQGPQQAPKYTQAERLAKNKMLAEKEQLLPFKRTEVAPNN
jgi:hypothetical protein